MAFEIFQPIFDQVDTVTETFVNDISSNVITTITPFVTVGLTISFIIYGYLIMRGGIEMPIFDFLKKAVLIGTVTSIALAGGLYQSSFMDVVTTLPDALANAFIDDPTTSDSAANILDQTAETGFDVAREAMDKISLFGGDALAYVVVFLLAIGVTTTLTVIAGALLLMAKVALALLAALGPLFIIGLLWQPTARFFEMWIGQVLNYGLTIILMAPVLGFSLSMFGSYAEDITLSGDSSLAYSIGGMLVLGSMLVLLILQLPSIAGGLAGGVGMSYLHESRVAGGMLGGRGKSQKKDSSGNITQNATRGRGAIGAAQAGGRGAAAVGRGTYAAARKAVGIFKKAA